MYSNSFLLSFGLKPTDFERTEGPIQSDDGFIYEAWEARKESLSCPSCGSIACIIHNRYTATIKLRSDILRKEVLICHRIRYACKECGKTFTVCLKGAMVGRSITVHERAAILAELNEGDTFARVARSHGLSETEVVNVFDEAYPQVKRATLPKILMIDEFKFKSPGSKYCCHLADLETSTSVDLIRSRQKAYLDEYFSSIPEKERQRVRILVTDMYDEYAYAARRWLPNATVVADKFHVVKQLTEAVNKLRVTAMSRNEKDTLAYNFMKQKWRLFLMRRHDIPDRLYTRKSTGETWHYDELMRHCIGLDDDLANAYDCLQDLFWIMRGSRSHADALRDLGFIVQKLCNCGCEALSKVASTYSKWSNEIAMGIAKNEFGLILSNGRMEALNDVAQTMIDAAYGYSNFERFRKRFLLAQRNKKRRP